MTTEINGKATVNWNEWKKQNPLLGEKKEVSFELNAEQKQFLEALAKVDGKTADHTKYLVQHGYLCLSRDAELVSLTDGPSKVVCTISRTRFAAAIRQAIDKTHTNTSVLVGEIVCLPNGVQFLEYLHFTPIKYYEIWAAREDGRDGFKQSSYASSSKCETFRAQLKTQPQVQKNGNVILQLREIGSSSDDPAIVFAQNKDAVEVVAKSKPDDILEFRGKKELNSFTKKLQFKIWEVLKSHESAK
jgi:hypothetical protein